MAGLKYSKEAVCQTINYNKIIFQFIEKVVDQMMFIQN